MTDAQPTRPPAPPPPTEVTLVCRGCLYPLDGLPTNRCPECGKEFDLAYERAMQWPRPSPVPWECKAASWCASLLYFIGCLATGFAHAGGWIVLIPPGVLLALTIGFGISGVRRKGEWDRSRGWGSLVAAIPWALLFFWISYREVSTNWAQIRSFWGLKP